jgi:hypothetical protein
MGWRPWQWLDKHLGKEAWAVHRMSKLTKIEKGETGKEQRQEHAHHVLWHQGGCSQRIHPGRPNSHFCILLWHFTVTAWECVKTSPQTLATKELQHDTLLTWLGPCDFSLFPWLKIKLKGYHFYKTEVNEAELQRMVDKCGRGLLWGGQ